MPELPEVETVKRSLEPSVKNKKIIDIEIKKPKLLDKQTVEQFYKRMKNCIIKSIDRRAKFLVFNLEKDNSSFYLISHLKMTGAYFVVKSVEDIKIANYRKHAHVFFQLNDGNQLIYSDIRRFGKMKVLTEEEYVQLESLNKLGPEPFWDNAEELFLKNISHRKIPIKSALLNQEIIAGIGNIYACEILFETKIHPEQPANTISKEKLSDLFKNTQIILQKSIDLGGTSFSDYVNAKGEQGKFQNEMKVYMKKICLDCGNSIEKITVGQRSTFFCPKCQVKE